MKFKNAIISVTQLKLLRYLNETFQVVPDHRYLRNDDTYIQAVHKNVKKIKQ